MAEWHLITCEYPPQPGGVSDYTHLVASRLARAGDAVHVWCPSEEGVRGQGSGTREEGRQTPDPCEQGVVVHRKLGKATPADLRGVGRMLDQFPGPRRLLVQWVPHGYGYRSMNLPFCLWLWERAALHRDCIDIMVHEPYLAFGYGSRRQDAVAVVHRLMTTILLRAACRVWTSIPDWEACWRRYALGRRVPFAWLPVPSTVPVIEDSAGVAATRARYAPAGASLVGHFGTYGRPIAEPLRDLLPALLLDRPGLTVLLLGRGGEALREELVHRHPGIAERVHATGPLDATDLSRHLSACDVLLQPYPDGVSSRRTSAMVGLCHGRAVVTTTGLRTEPLWAESGAVKLAPAGDVAALTEATWDLLEDEAERARLGAAARALYEARFDVSHTVAALRAAVASGPEAKVG